GGAACQYSGRGRCAGAGGPGGAGVAAPSAEVDVTALLENLGPAVGFAADDGFQLSGRAAAACEEPRLFELRDHRRVGIDAHDLAVELLDDRRRGAGGSGERDPGRAFLEPG